MKNEILRTSFCYHTTLNLTCSQLFRTLRFSKTAAYTISLSSCILRSERHKNSPHHAQKSHTNKKDRKISKVLHYSLPELLYVGNLLCVRFVLHVRPTNNLSLTLFLGYPRSYCRHLHCRLIADRQNTKQVSESTISSA